MHFQLPILANGATLLTELGVTPIQVQALINTLGLVQQLRKLPADRLPNLALTAPRGMTDGWWKQFIKWLNNWGLSENRLYKYTLEDIRKHAQQQIWTQGKYYRKKAVYKEVVNSTPGKLFLQPYLTEAGNHGYAKSLLILRIRASA